MTKDLETADTIAKLVLAVSTIALFLLKAIQGPFAFSLFILSIVVLVIYAAKLLYKKIS